MNGKRQKHKPKKCALTESQLSEFAEIMKKRFYSYKELTDILKEKYGYNGVVLSVLDFLNVRGYMIAEEEHYKKYGYKIYYKVMTPEDYEKIAEEHRENAKRRLLAAVSY